MTTTRLARLRDRRDAGERLGDRLIATLSLTGERTVVLALPRGGVPVASEVARRLRAPLDVFVARKIGAPGHPEAGIGAIAEGHDDVVVDERAVRALRLSPEDLATLVEAERRELRRRVDQYRQGRPMPDVARRDVVLVDDGLATGVTAEAALRALRAQDPASLVLAVPACAPDTAERLRSVADHVVCVLAPRHFHAVGLWYETFDQTTDEEVLGLLEAARIGASR
jgi:putative phosphoribosyl transferase